MVKHSLDCHVLNITEEYGIDHSAHQEARSSKGVTCACSFFDDVSKRC